MTGPSDQPSSAGRKPVTGPRAAVFAGRFYPLDPTECSLAAERYVKSAVVEHDRTRWLGGIVPHAGWMYSGAIAGKTLAMMSNQPPPEVVIVFGAIHTPLETARAALDVHDRWSVPGAELEVSGPLFAELPALQDLFVVDPRFHVQEHAVEVELPLIRATWPGALVLPVEVPVSERAIEMGQAVAQRVLATGLNAVYLASSDLTHYGPNYRFTPAGIGRSALQWAKGNDQRLLQLVVDMQAERIVPEARSRLNACGGGAIAAMLAACREHGASQGRLLQHTNSFEVIESSGSASDAVGYASMVVG